MTNTDSENKDTFRAEAEQLIDQSINSLVELEEKEGEISIINSLFRFVHTLKGNCNVEGFEQAGMIAHEMENIFQYMRDGKVKLSGNNYDLLYNGFDILTEILLNNTEKETEEVGEYIDRLKELLEDKSTPVPRNIYIPNMIVNQAKIEIARKKLELPEMRSCYVKVQVDPESPSDKVMSYVVFNNLSKHILFTDPPLEKLKDNYFFTTSVEAFLITDLSEDLINSTITLNVTDYTYQEVDFEEWLPSHSIIDETDSRDEAKSKDSVDNLIKEIEADIRKESSPTQIVEFEQHLIDNIIELIARLMIPAYGVQGEVEILPPELNNLKEQLSIMIETCNELLDASLLLRLRPLKKLFSKFPRIVRDTCRECDKKVALGIEGEMVLAGKEVIDLLASPMLHIIRNAIDHGMEEPEERIARGKSEIGKLLIFAEHCESDLVVTVCDDGKGINTGKVGQLAVEKKLLTAEGLRSMSVKEINNMILAPGFSTTTKVTSMSGRGVGMDVVLSNIKEIDGNVDIESVEGEGTTFILTMPFSK